MSPFTTFQSWGSSSIDVFRRSAPSPVTRGSALILKAGPSISFADSSFSRSFSAPSTIVRNLYSVKVRPFMPDRSWRKIAGPFEVSFTRSIISSRIGDSTASIRSETATSATRLTRRAASFLGAVVNRR
jgi:hypothetical protein